jgi:uncharacterized protein YutE (UPF0331/DUF86 family)
MDLSTLNDILFHTLAPWLEANQKQDKFKVLLSGTILIPAQSTFYEVDYLPALNPKCKYYSIRIHNSAVSFFTKFSESFNGALYDDQRKFLVVKALDKQISQKLADTAQVIAQRNYNFFAINQELNKPIRDEIYIIHLIKHYLIWLYLELREIVQEHVAHDYLDEAALYASFFQEYEFTTRLKEVPDEIKQEIRNEQRTKTLNKKFKPQPYDFRGKEDGVLTFDEIVQSAERFSLFEQELYAQGFIDEEYRFISNKQKSHTEKFALIALAMVEKGYLRKTNLGKLIEPIKYRKFIEHRYQVNIDRQYRNFKRQPEKVQEFIEGTYWLSKLPKY